jgi:nucleoside-triphosphatase THEP1
MDLPRSCIILTGPIGSGKTCALRRIIEELAFAGRRVSALLQPDRGRGPDGVALGFSMEFLSGAGGRLVAERVELARELGSGELPAAGFLELGRFVFDRSAFARAGDFMMKALGAKEGPEALGIDEIGRLEMLRGEGLADCLERALAAVANEGGARVLLCSAREDCVLELRHLAQASGLRTETFPVSGAGEALLAARRSMEY